MLVLILVAGQPYGVLVFAPIPLQYNGVLVFWITIEDQCALHIRAEQPPTLRTLLVSGGEVGAACRTDRHAALHSSSISRSAQITKSGPVPARRPETTSENLRSFIGSLSSVRPMIARTGGESY